MWCLRVVTAPAGGLMSSVWPAFCMAIDPATSSSVRRRSPSSPTGEPGAHPLPPPRAQAPEEDMSPRQAAAAIPWRLRSELTSSGAMPAHSSTVTSGRS